MKKIFNQICSLLMILCITGCTTVTNKEGMSKNTYQKDLSRISRYETNLPKNYKLINFKERALQYDNLVFDKELSGMYRPFIWEDTYNQSFGIPAYVGDGRMHQNGAQEAVTGIAAVLSATLLGIDKSDQDGINYVEQLQAYYSYDEKIILNNPSGSSSTTSMWYLIYPAILFTQVSLLYPEELEIREKALNTIESWYSAFLVMKETQSFDYTGFDFLSNSPYKNNIWSEPDCVAGMALLLYYGYELTANERYLDASMEGINYITSYFGSPLYEALLYFAPYLVAMYNAKYEGTFHIEDTINDVLNGNSIPRGGWGSILGTWGVYSMNGLMGSTSDGGGYAFAMNTFTAAYAMSPVVKYDTRYADSIGTWYLNLVSNSRYFFSDQTEKENQSATSNSYATDFSKETKHVIPYEGIRKSQNSKTPWFGGDPTVYGWADTDFSLYSGAHIGLLASIVEETNIKGILKINLNKADYFNQEYETYLLYNPYSKNKIINYLVNSKGIVDLYDGVTKKIIAKKVSEKVKIEVEKNSSAVIIEVPSNSEILHKDNKYFIEDTLIATDVVVVKVNALENNQEVEGEFLIPLSIQNTYLEDEVEYITVKVKDKNYKFNKVSELVFSSEEIGEGSTTFYIDVIMKSGLKDKTEVRLLLK